MASELEKVFLFFGTAVSGSDDAGYPEGERHTVAGLGRGREIDYAAEIAAEHFLDAGWTEVQWEEGGEFDTDGLADAEPELVETYEECKKNGSAGIVFDTVVEE